MTPDQKIAHAAYTARVAHGAIGQRRKASGIEYIHHPADVVKILVDHCPHYTRRMIAAAWLHDVVEDTKLTIDFIRDAFDTPIARMVYGLTNERPPGMNRAERHAHNVARLAKCAWDVKTIKLADCIANMRDIVREDPMFAPTYLAEKRVLLDEALIDGCPVLWAMADKIITDYFAENTLYSLDNQLDS